MGQTPLGFSTVGPGGALGPTHADIAGLLAVTSGGLRSALDVTAAAVVKATPGRLAKVVIVVAPSAGALTLNDCATTGAAATANQIASIPFGDLVAGQVITLDWPCAVGIVVSSPGTGGQISVSFA